MNRPRNVAMHETRANRLGEHKGRAAAHARFGVTVTPALCFLLRGDARWLSPLNPLQKGLR